jgi:hypothetical protein
MPKDDKHKQEPTQQTQPKGIDPKTGKPYEPVEIPVPTRADWDKVLKRATKPVPREERAKDQGDALDPYGENWSAHS